MGAAKTLIDLEFAGRLNLCAFYETVPQRLLEEGVYLGSAEAAKNVSLLQRLGITHILNAAEGANFLFPEHFCYLTLGLHDNAEQDIEAAIERGLIFIDECIAQGGAVLIHCQAGISRSVAIACAHLMRKRGMTLADALAFV